MEYSLLILPNFKWLAREKKLCFLYHNEKEKKACVTDASLKHPHTFS
jgi:hypothetical protein